MDIVWIEFGRRCESEIIRQRAIIVYMVEILIEAIKIIVTIVYSLSLCARARVFMMRKERCLLKRVLCSSFTRDDLGNVVFI